ncbi:MAG: hypothetical protein KF774_15295 [Planctomyces sp.]|nr:hypothetical protein [Planctomyces sp.]
MSRPLLRLLHWQMQFDARRIALWLTGGIYLILAGWLVLTIVDSSRWNPFPPAGIVAIQTLLHFHSLLAIGFGVFRASRMTEDRTAGVVGLVKLTGLRPRDWVLYRLLCVVVAWLPVWVLRWPLYAYVRTLGGWTMDEVWTAELLQWAALLTAASVTLLIARFCETPRATRFLAAGVLLLSQMLLALPEISIGVVTYVTSGAISVPAVVENASELLTRTTLLSQLWNRPVSMPAWRVTLASLGLHLGGSALALWALARTAFFRADTDESVGAAPAERRSKQSRASRRVWDDALAWQCCEAHGGGRATVVLKSLLYLACGILLLALWVSRSPLYLGMLILGPVAGALIAVFKPGDCISRELKAGTLSTLMLLPVTGRDLYDGWARGNRRLAIPDLLWVTATLTILMLQPESVLPLGVRLSILCACLTLLLAGPLLFINQLVHFHWMYLPAGCACMIPVVGIPVFSVILGTEGHLTVAVVFFMAYVLVARVILLSLIEEQVQRRAEEQA